MKKLLVFMLLLCPSAYAGLGVCHDGGTTVTQAELDGRSSFFKNTTNCVYYELGKNGIDGADYQRIKSVIASFGTKYSKWNGSEPVEMTQGEKDAVDLADTTAEDTKLRTVTKSLIDGQNPEGLSNRCAFKPFIDQKNVTNARINAMGTCIVTESNLSAIKSCIQALGTLKEDFTISDLKTSYDNCVDNGDVDE